jgi:hypothetical protein
LKNERPVRKLLLLTFLAGCAPAAEDPVAAGDAADAAGKEDNAAAPAGRTLLLSLEHGAFAQSQHPSALVYVPAAFDPTPPLSLIVYLHGWYNCVENVVRASGKPCTRGGPARQSYALPQQLEAAGKNALLLVPELSFDEASSAPGRLADDGAFTALLDEALGKLGDVGSFTLDDVGTVVVASHSGGYEAAAGIAVRGGVPVNEVWLLDSLYGNTGDFDAWVNQAPSSFDGPTRRFADVYTATAGTLHNSQAMATRAAGWVAADDLVDDRTTATLSSDRYAHGLLFKRTGLSHDGVPRYYFGKLAASSTLPDVSR